MRYERLSDRWPVSIPISLQAAGKKRLHACMVGSQQLRIHIQEFCLFWAARLWRSLLRRWTKRRFGCDSSPRQSSLTGNPLPKPALVEKFGDDILAGYGVSANQVWFHQTPNSGGLALGGKSSCAVRMPRHTHRIQRKLGGLPRKNTTFGITLTLAKPIADSDLELLHCKASALTTTLIARTRREKTLCIHLDPFLVAEKRTRFRSSRKHLRLPSLADLPQLRGHANNVFMFSIDCTRWFALGNSRRCSVSRTFTRSRQQSNPTHNFTLIGLYSVLN